MGYSLGCKNPLILTFDPNFQGVIQVVFGALQSQTFFSLFRHKETFFTFVGGFERVFFVSTHLKWGIHLGYPPPTMPVNS